MRAETKLKCYIWLEKLTPTSIWMRSGIGLLEPGSILTVENFVLVGVGVSGLRKW